ncbi:MAG: hypothetical protein MRK02_16625 [Candidatus Scalindua sp.]|nr:hypothetical protein [Candidatus Scalindua sp.]
MSLLIYLRKDEGRKTMNIKRKNNLFLVGFVVIMAWAVTATAQDKPADNMQIVIEKVRADKKLLVAENLQLTETEAKDFWPVYEQYQHELFLIRVRTAKLIKDYSDAYGKMTDDSARELLDEYMNIEKLTLKLHKSYLRKFRKILPEIKVTRYYQIENKIQVAMMFELAANIPLMKIDQ